MWKALILVGPLVTSTALAAEESKKVAVVKEWRGHNAVQEAPKRMVVEDQRGWEEVWSGMKGSIVPKPATPKIDFDTNKVIAVFMGRRMSGGYSVTITSIEEDGKLLVTVREKRPPRGAMVTMALTSPYHVVVIPKTSKPIEFIDEKK